jgi:hypothetical protein
MKARLRTLAILFIMSICLMGDLVVPTQAQSYWPGQYQSARAWAYRYQIGLDRRRARRRQTIRILRHRRRSTVLNRRRNRAAYRWSVRRRRAMYNWSVRRRRAAYNRSVRRRRAMYNWSVRRRRAIYRRQQSNWSRRRNWRARNWTPGVPRGRARGYWRNSRHARRY